MTALATVGDNTIDEYVGEDSGTFVGGNALNVAVQLRGLGHDVSYAGAVGTDAAGERVRSALDGLGVDLGGLVVLDGATSVSRIRVRPDGERVIELEDFAVCAEYRPTEGELDRLASHAFVHVGWTPYAGEIRSALASRGARISQDCAISAGYEHLDVAFCSAGDDLDGARAMAEEALDGGARLAVVTCGPAGSLAFDGRTWWRQEADPVGVVDTTGAGDSFIAGFLGAYAEGEGGGSDVAVALRAGAATAARTCGHRGGWPQEAGAVLEMDPQAGDHGKDRTHAF